MGKGQHDQIHTSGTYFLDSVCDHLAECRSVALGQVPFMKIRNLVHFVWRITNAYVSDNVRLYKQKHADT